MSAPLSVRKHRADEVGATLSCKLTVPFGSQSADDISTSDRIIRLLVEEGPSIPSTT
jgi:hypothetical protein